MRVHLALEHVGAVGIANMGGADMNMFNGFDLVFPQHGKISSSCEYRLYFLQRSKENFSV